MKKLTYLMLALMLLTLPVTAMAAETVDSVQSMMEALPTVEEFQAMDSEAQLEAYNQTQFAYDAYMALNQEDREAISGAEETFEALFAHFNSMIMPLDPVAEPVAPEAPAPEKDRTETLLSGVLVLAVVIGILRTLNKKKT